MIQTFSSTIRRKEMDAVLTCMVDEKIGPGEINTRLIQAVKEFFGVSGAIALRSPDTALVYAIKACSIEDNSKVMVSALAPAWHLAAVVQAGYTPLILDVDSTTSCVTPAIVEEGIKNGGRLLVLHESMGILPDFEGIAALGIPVVEDISQSAGSFIPENLEEVSKAPEGTAVEVKGKKAGNFGLFAVCGLEEHDVITSGGGALLMAGGRKEWPVLKHVCSDIAGTQILPDINCALALTQVKEFKRNETVRKEIYNLFARMIMAGKNRTFVREAEYASTAWSFPLVLNSGFKDVKQYTAKKDIEITLAFENSIIGVLEKAKENLIEGQEVAMYDYSACHNAKALYLRTALFPLYPRLAKSQIDKISKVLGTLP